MKKISLLLIVSAIACVSCSLDESRDTENYVNANTFFKNREQCIEAVNGCYPMLRSMYNSGMALALEGCNDLLFCNGSAPDGRLDISPATPRRGQYVWQYCYQGIRNANLCVDRIPGASAVTESERIELLGEAKVLRAYFYYLLTSFFGDVPFYLEPLYTVADLNAVAKYPRTSAVEIRDAVIADLMETLPQMQQERTSDTPGNRLRYSCGMMIAAKMAMWNACAVSEAEAKAAYWNQALEFIAALETVYGEFSEERYPLAEVKFSCKNTSESIMEIQHTYTLGGLTYVSDFATICMPYPKTKESTKYAGVEVPELGSMATCNVPLRPTVYFLGIMPNDGRDLRYNQTMVWSWKGTKFSDTNTRPFLGPKFWYEGMQGASDGNNYRIFRYADVILMKAECLAMTNDNTNAVAYLNKVRGRAGLDDYVFISAERLQEEIRNERARELVGEFQRKFDLVRWGIWYEQTSTHNEQPYVLKNIRQCHEYYPIPDTQVALSGGALDNKAYSL